MDYDLVIKGTMPNLNDYLHGERIAIRKNGKFTTKGNVMKQEHQRKVVSAVRSQLMGIHIENPVMIYYTFFEPNMKRDLDNISAFAHKVIQDGLVKGGLIQNDGWKNIVGFSDEFFVDKENPRIEILIREVEANGWEKNVFKNNNW